VRLVSCLAAVTTIGLVACGPTAPAAHCDAVEAIVEPTQGHTLDAASATFVHHPPTSGRHVHDAPTPGSHAEPIPEARQVAALERGWVLLQYGGKASIADRRRLHLLAGATVIVAPAARIDGNRAIAFTAWQHRQLCDHAATKDARAFVKQFAGKPVT
jgi:hypothetical protein